VIIHIALPPGKTPVLQLYTTSLVTVGSAITGVAVAGIPVYYAFNIPQTSGDYLIRITSPEYSAKLRILPSSYKIEEQWEQLEDVAITISPQAFVNLPLVVSGNVLEFFNNATQTINIARTTGVFDGTPMEFVIETSNKVQIFLLTGLTSSTNSVNVTISPIIPQEDCLQWSLRRTSTGLPLLYGPAKQIYAAFKD